MPSNGNTDYRRAAQLTVELVDHSHVPNRVSEAIMETLIEMGAESGVDIWQPQAGLSVNELTTLYSQYETGAGYRRSRLYSNYETGRKARRRRRQTIKKIQRGDD